MPLPKGLTEPDDEQVVDTSDPAGFADLADTLPLSSEIGQPFVRDSVPSPTSAGRFQRVLPGQTVQPQNDLSYTAIPTNPEQAREVAFQTVSSLVAGEKISPWNIAAITTSLEAMVDSPLAAYVLRTPGMIDDWQATIWTNTLGGLTVDLDELNTGVGSVDYINRTKVADFFKTYDSTLSSDERKLISQMLAVMPDSVSILEASDVRPEGEGLWATFKLGWRTITRAPEAIRISVNDPRDQMLAEMHQYLSANPLNTIEDHANFMMFFMERTTDSIEQVASSFSGFNALAEATVALPFTTFGNEYNDWFNRSANPDSFANREHLSIGQNIAIGIGTNPGDYWYKTQSGWADGIIGVVFDPQNLAFGVGNAIRNAAKVPRIVGMSKSKAFLDGFSLLGGQSTRRLPVFDRGIVSRFGYALFSKDVDTLIETRRIHKLSDKLSKMSSPAAITEMMPDWLESSKLVGLVARETDPRLIREIMKNGLILPEMVADSSPMLSAKTAAQLANSTTSHQVRIVKWLDDGGSLGGLSSIDEIQGYLAPLAAEITPEGVAALARIERNAARLADSPILNTVPIKGGNMVVRGVGDTIAGFDEATGALLGGIEKGLGSNPIVGTVVEHQRRGVFSALKGQIPDYGINRTSIENVTPQARAALESADPTAATVYTNVGALSGDGSAKIAISTLGTEGRKPLNLKKNLDELATYLDNAGFTDDAAKLIEGGSVSSLSPEGIGKVAHFVQSKGSDFGTLAGEMVVTPNGRKMMFAGADAGTDGAASIDELRDSYMAVSRAKLEWADIHTKMDQNLWMIKDTGLQLPSSFRKLRIKISTSTNATWMRQLRRSGFRVTHRLPTNISLIHTGEGSRQLRNWVKALGGNDDLANKWSDTFRAGNSGTRKDIVLEALAEVSENIKNPMLRDGILEFGHKQGNYTYFFDRSGRELGLAADGSIMPMTMSHFSDEFAMPDAKKLLRSLARYGNAKVLPGVRRGILPGTRKKRKLLATNIQAKMKRVHGVDNVPASDLQAMAYADILGGEYGRATGMGHVAQAAGVVSGAYGFLHNQFVIAQLAFRPIAWSTRVLLEETFRADLMGLPSMWKNPHDWASQVMEAAAIRKLPAELAAQGEVADMLVARMFTQFDGLDLNEAKRIIPNIETLLADAGILVTDSSRAQAFIASYVGKELSGLGTTAGTIGLRGNISKRALMRERKLRRTFEKMDKDGLGEAFRWDIDGETIAQRSLYDAYIKEASSATIPLHYSTTGMTPRGLQTYGRAYGRQIFQMNNDPIVSTYGYSRAIALAEGNVSRHDGAHLVASSYWPKMKHIVDKKFAGDGIEGLSEVEKADKYLAEYVDEVVETLFGATGLAGDNPGEKVRILRAIKNGGTVTIESGGSKHVLNASRSNYEGFVGAVANFSEGAYNDGRQLPRTISAFVDPRFGEKDVKNIYRRVTDWSMMKFGEEATQKLNRQPAYVHIRGRWYRYYKDLGWGEDAARQGAAEKSAEMVNYIFFDNSNIPQFLKDMNGVIPFFSAMYEVGSTWLYKIPSQNVMPVGYAQLGRRVERTLRGMQATGLVEYDIESNSMTLNVSKDMVNAEGPIAAAFGRTLFEYIRLPVTILEHLGGIGNLITDGEFEKSDFGAWSKDGYTIGIGNPLDPTTHGLMAINQFSLGLSPVLQLPASMTATAVFSQSDERLDTEGESVADFLIANEELDIGTLLRANQEAFIEANGEEIFNRAMNYDWDLTTLKMPPSIRIPNTSTWETLINNVVFPFGKMESLGEVITSVSPSAMNYVWRGLLQKYGGEGGDEIAGMLFGQMSKYSMASEILTQIQMIEASEGLVTLSLELADEVQEIVETAELQIAYDESNAPYILNPEGEAALKAQALFDRIGQLNMNIMKRANDNAAGSQLMRGIMGQLGPVTPRMWTQEQKQIADYWSSRELALESKVTGSFNFGELLTSSGGINTFADMERLAALSSAWLNDPTGDEAKVWMAQQNPALMVFSQGKTFWGPAGPPPEIERFDEWVEQIESGDREAFAPEVFMARYQRTGINIDKEIAIIAKYGNDPNKAATDILKDYDAYYDLTDDYNRRYDALEFLDTYLYDGKYAAYRDSELDNLALYELLSERARDTREEIDTINDLLSRTDLEPDERRRILGIISSTEREYNNALDDLNNLDNADKFSNPREQIINRYWDLSNAFYSERNELYDQLGDVQDKAGRGIVFETVRILSDQWYNTPHIIEGYGGENIIVPAPEVRTWNSRPQVEKQERIMALIGKKPEWLTQFESEILASESATFTTVLPMNPQMRQIYDAAALKKFNIRQQWAADPSVFTRSARDKMVSDVEKELEQFLADAGRISELVYRNAVPFERLASTNMLPQSLMGIVPVLNQVLEELRAADKSPTTNAGYERMMALKVWLEETYFVQNPTARADFMSLGSSMFGEGLPSAVYAKLFQGDFYGELG